MMLCVFPLFRQPDAIALDGAVVFEHRSGLQPALAQLQLHRLHVLGVEGDNLAGLDGRLKPFRSELAQSSKLARRNWLVSLGCMANRYGLMRLGSTTLI